MSVGGTSNTLPSINGAQYQQFSANTTGVAIFSGPGIFYGVGVIGIGSSWTITLYDNTTNSGPQMTASALAISAVGALSLGVPPDIGVWCKTGLYIVLAGTTAGILNVFYQTIQ